MDKPGQLREVLLFDRPQDLIAEVQQLRLRFPPLLRQEMLIDPSLSPLVLNRDPVVIADFLSLSRNGDVNSVGGDGSCDGI